MDLKFDKMTVDTELAQLYLKENEALSELYADYNNLTHMSHPYIFDGKLFEKQSTKSAGYLDNKQPELYSSQIQALASSLKQNANLIAQLEYHIRNIPIEDTNAQLKLIIQHLNCHAIAVNFKLEDTKYHCFSDEPLLNLRTVVHMLIYSSRMVHLVNIAKATTVITHLFVKLCDEAGFDNIFVEFIDGTQLITINKDQPKTTNEEIQGLDSGTVAVVSEDADIDSAVDKFLSVSKQTPWRLRRILVQESVYQQFKDALSWKCSLKKQESENLASNTLSTDTLNYNGKTFLIDSLELPKLSTQSAGLVVTVEAYRTTKEMISFLQTDKARYLSLWANNIAEINEVTHSTKSPVVWVNNISDFRGPPTISAAVFSYLYEPITEILKCDKISKLQDMLQAWLKLDYETRRDTLYNAFDKYMSSDPEYKQSVERAICDCTREGFVDVGKDYICTGMWSPVGIKVIADLKENSISKNVFKSILNGNGFAVYTSHDTLASELDVFEKAGVPLVCVKQFHSGNFLAKSWYARDRVRAVWTNTGTIFAN